MTHRTPAGRIRRRLLAITAGAALVLASLTAGASPASAGSGPVPDFDNEPPCVIDILAISCFVEGRAAGGGEIVSWEWEYPGAFGNHASGQSTTLRFETTGVFDVTLTVTDDRGETGSITKPTVVEPNS